MPPSSTPGCPGRGAGPVELDLSGVEEIDTAGLQILLAFARTTRDRGAEVTVTGCPDVVTEVLDVLGLDAATLRRRTP